MFYSLECSRRDLFIATINNSGFPAKKIPQTNRVIDYQKRKAGPVTFPSDFAKGCENSNQILSSDPGASHLLLSFVANDKWAHINCLQLQKLIIVVVALTIGH